MDISLGSSSIRHSRGAVTNWTLSPSVTAKIFPFIRARLIAAPDPDSFWVTPCSGLLQRFARSARRAWKQPEGTIVQRGKFYHCLI